MNGLTLSDLLRPTLCWQSWTLTIVLIVSKESVGDLFMHVVTLVSISPSLSTLCLLFGSGIKYKVEQETVRYFPLLGLDL